ncbi:MAG: hypothetical protein HYV15_01165 [Elusimicrobia bacterium]|nr:hypothetical protein [Elusimicrobiota bacterium]
MLALPAALLLSLPPAPRCAAAVVRLEAYGGDGRLLDQAALRRTLDPLGASPTSGLRLSAPDGTLLDGRPWWVEGSTTPAWRWEGAARMTASLPWPLPEDGFSTIRLDNGGAGYEDGRTLLVNEEAARWAYAALQDSFKERTSAWKPAYAPSRKAAALVEAAKNAVARATAASERRKRARLFDQALSAVSVAWQQVLVEHGRQVSKDADAGPRLRRGLSLDESVLGRIQDFDALAGAVAESGASWVRLVFAVPQGDPGFAKEASFTLYDELLRALEAKRLRVLGSVLDSQLWPAGLTPELYGERTRNLVMRYKDRVRVWEVASEPNGTWLGGRRPLSDETVLLCVQKAVVEVKRADASLRTAATLHWWDGTAPDARHGLADWTAWAKERGFGAGIDEVGLSVYPHRHPLGLSLEPGTVDGPLKDLTLLYNAAAPALVPGSLGGGFYWGALEHMLPAGRQPTTLYKLYRKSLKDLKK